MSELPGDLVEEILCRVPATSVKQLRSTCKQWNRLFNDKRIIRKQCDKAPKQCMVLMLTNSFTVIPMSIINLHETPSVKREGHPLDPYYNNAYQLFHCDSLLLCTSNDLSRVLVWNPHTNQSRWIQFKKRNNGCNSFFLGYSQDSESCNKKSYKVLNFDPIGGTKDVTIYELNSDSYRILDDDNNPGWRGFQVVSLKGNSYWFDKDETKMDLGIFLNKFDFSTEKIGGRVLLPYQCQEYENMNVCVFKEEKLSVALQRETTSKTEIWVTDEIDETKAVSWTKVLALDLSLDYEITDLGSFLLKEEKKKVVVCYMTWYASKEMIYIVREDSIVRELDLGVDAKPLLFKK